MKYRRRRNGSIDKRKLIIITAICLGAALVVFLINNIFFKKNVVEEVIPEVIEEVEVVEEEVFMEELEIITDKIDLVEDYGFELKEGDKKTEIKMIDLDVKSQDLLEEINRDREDLSEDNSTLVEGYLERDMEKEELIKKSEKGLTEWKDDSALFETLQKDSQDLLEEREGKRR